MIKLTWSESQCYSECACNPSSQVSKISMRPSTKFYFDHYFSSVMPEHLPASCMASYQLAVNCGMILLDMTYSLGLVKKLSL